MVRTDPRPKAPENLQVIRLDDIDFGEQGPAMIKVDVESMELPMLQGADKTLRAYRPSLYVEDSEVPPESDGRHRPTRVMQYLYDRNYLVVDLVRSGFTDATSTLFVPREREREMMDRLHAIAWRGGA